MAPPTKPKNNKWLWLTLITAVIIAALVQLPLLRLPKYANEDLRFFYWMYRFIDPTLFTNDALLGYQFGTLDLGFTTLLFNKVSLLYGSLYALTSPFLSPFLFSKLLTIPMALISAYYLFNIGRRLTNQFNAYLMTAAFIAIVIVPFSSIALSVGLPRTFTLPLLLAALFYMLSDNKLGMALVLLFSPVYPPAFLLILMTFGIKFGLETIQQRRIPLTKRQFIILGGAFILAVSFLLPATVTGLNTVPSEAEAEQPTVYESPLFGDEGRYPLLHPSPLTGNGGLLDSGLVGFYCLLLITGIIPAFLVLRRRFNLLPMPFWYLALAALVGYIISWAAILLTPSATFHMPSRYMRGTIFIISFLLFLLNVPILVQYGAIALSRRRRNETTSVDHLSTFNIPAPLFGILSLVLLLPLAVYTQWPSNYYEPNPETAELISFIHTLPQDSLIGGYPCFLDDIPLYAQRKVTYSCEIESRDMTMMTNALAAYYAQTPAETLAFCQQYGVDYLVISPDTFNDDFINQERILFEPLNTSLKAHLADTTDFALSQIPESQKLFQNQTYFVVPCTTAALTSS